MVFDVLAELGCVEVFAAVVFGAVRRPVRRLHRSAARGADHAALPHHPPVLLRHPDHHHGGGAPLLPSLLVLLRLALAVLLQLTLGAVARPVEGGAHQLLAFVLNVLVAVVLWRVAPQRLQLVVDGGLLRSRRSFPLFLPLAGPPDADHDAEEPQQTEDHAQHWHQVGNGRTLHQHLHLHLHHRQHHRAVVAFGQSVGDGVGRLLDLPTVVVLRPAVLLKGHGDLHSVSSGVGQVTEDEEGSLFGQSPSHREIPQLRADVLHRSALRHFVLLEDERNVGTAVVKVTTVGLALRVERRRGVRRGADPPLVTRRREAGQKLMLYAVVTSGAGRSDDGSSVVGVSGRKCSGEDAWPTPTTHL